MSEAQGTLFDKRFLEKHAGQIMTDPTTALVELVANSWDAYATEVDIIWPNKQTATCFSIKDNGHGMTKQEALSIWRTIDYNRLEHQGDIVKPPTHLKDSAPRKVYGRNGRGRHAAFSFSSPYRLRSWKSGTETVFRISQGVKDPIKIEVIDQRNPIHSHGTEIYAEDIIPSKFTSDEVRSLLSTRFLMDPSFSVSVDGVKISFGDIPENALEIEEVPISDLGIAKLYILDSSKADRTTKQHGIAWWVKRRLVGNPDWSSFEDKFIDGRTEEAKRYSFIVQADFLSDSVKPDWSGFKENDENWTETRNLVNSKIRGQISDFLQEKRTETKANIKASYHEKVVGLPRLSQDRWNGLLSGLVENCPTLGETQINQVMGVLANLEISQSQYSLLDKLHSFSPEDFDSWNQLLEDWTIKSAKIALDEIAHRLKLIEEIRYKSSLETTNEVQELQPLFGKSLWIFGPQFESIEFTSNKGMTKVIRKFFDKKDAGSLNRPDFVIRPDSTIGFYARPAFDEEYNESGTSALIIIELKRPGIAIGDEEKSQAWKYIRELKQKQYVTDDTHVHAYVLGDSIDPVEASARTEGDRIIIKPMLYNTFIGQAEKRMMNLHKRLTETPFMEKIQNEMEAPLQPILDIG